VRGSQVSPLRAVQDYPENWTVSIQEITECGKPANMLFLFSGQDIPGQRGLSLPPTAIHGFGKWEFMVFALPSAAAFTCLIKTFGQHFLYLAITHHVL